MAGTSINPAAAQYGMCSFTSFRIAAELSPQSLGASGRVKHAESRDECRIAQNASIYESCDLDMAAAVNIDTAALGIQLALTGDPQAIRAWAEVVRVIRAGAAANPVAPGRIKRRAAAALCAWPQSG